MSQTRFAGQAALVTGGAQGIGRAIAERFVAEGANVLLFDIDGQLAGQVAADLREQGGSAEAIAGPADLTIADDGERLVATAVERFGRVDSLVTSIHFSASGDDDETWREWFETIFLPAVRLTRLQPGTPPPTVTTGSFPALTAPPPAAC